MNGFIPIGLPTKKYIRAYVISQLGPKPVMNSDHHIGSKFYDLLTHETNEDKSRFANSIYNAELKLYVSYHTFKHRGGFLNETNIKNFNLYVEREIKSRFYFHMDLYMDLLPNITANLPAVRKQLGIGIDDWDCDSIKKDYYRYRRKNDMGIFYKNGLTHVSGGRYLDPSF